MHDNDPRNIFLNQRNIDSQQQTKQQQQQQQTASQQNAQTRTDAQQQPYEQRLEEMKTLAAKSPTRRGKSTCKRHFVQRIGAKGKGTTVKRSTESVRKAYNSLA